LELKSFPLKNLQRLNSSTSGKSQRRRAATARWKRTSVNPVFLSLIESIEKTSPQKSKGSCLADNLLLKRSTIFRAGQSN